MFYAQSENKYITEGTSFELDGVQYPPVWLNQATEEQKAEIGLVEVVATNSPADERFYWVSSSLDGAELTYTNTPKDLGELKTSWTLQVNNTAYSILFTSDWMVNKAIETEVAMPADWKAYRASVRSVASSTKTAIDACATVDELITTVSDIQWPNDPNYVAPVLTPAN